MINPPSLTEAEIAEINRRVVEHRKHPVTAALRDAARAWPRPEAADRNPLTEDLYRLRTGRVRQDTL